MEPVIEIKNLKTSFMTSNGEVQAVRGISFSVNPGEILGVVGESGSGKSVTSMSILRLLADTAVIKEGSEILFEGENLIVKRESREGYDLMTTSFPALVTVLKSNVPPRCATLKTKMAARRKTITILTETEMKEINLKHCGLKGSPTRVVSTYVPTVKKTGYIVHRENYEEAAGELITRLREDGVF